MGQNDNIFWVFGEVTGGNQPDPYISSIYHIHDPTTIPAVHLTSRADRIHYPMHDYRGARPTTYRQLIKRRIRRRETSNESPLVDQSINQLINVKQYWSTSGCFSLFKQVRSPTVPTHVAAKGNHRSLFSQEPPPTYHVLWRGRGTAGVELTDPCRINYRII